jgi:heme/copper-type cytochrome/quinol oxidase subunit 3
MGVKRSPVFYVTAVKSSAVTKNSNRKKQNGLQFINNKKQVRSSFRPEPHKDMYVYMFVFMFVDVFLFSLCLCKYMFLSM